MRAERTDAVLCMIPVLPAFEGKSLMRVNSANRTTTVTTIFLMLFSGNAYRIHPESQSIKPLHFRYFKGSTGFP